jgi:hypothetical protein
MLHRFIVWPYGPALAGLRFADNCFWFFQDQLLLPVWLLHDLSSVVSSCASIPEAVPLCIGSGIGLGACKYVTASCPRSRKVQTGEAVQRSSPLPHPQPHTTDIRVSAMASRMGSARGDPSVRGHGSVRFACGPAVVKEQA